MTQKAQVAQVIESPQEERLPPGVIQINPASPYADIVEIRECRPKEANELLKMRDWRVLSVGVVHITVKDAPGQLKRVMAYVVGRSGARL